MKAKIDLEKFVCSLMERYYEKIHIDPTTTKCWLDSVLEDQGLEYKDGEIVEIEQEQPYNKPLFFEKGKWYTCIAKVDGFKVGHTYQSKMDGTVSNDSGAMYGYHNDVNLIFRPATDDEIPIKQEEREELRKWLNFENTHEDTTITIPDNLKGTDPDGGVVGEKGEEGEPLIEDDRIRKAILSGMNFLKFQGRETFSGIAIDDYIAWLKKQSIKEDSFEIKAIKEQIENLKKRIEDNQLGCIVQRLDKIIELLQEAILVIPKEPYAPPITYKRPLDPDPNVLGGWATTASTFGSDYDIDTDKIKQDETNKPKS